MPVLKTPPSPSAAARAPSRLLRSAKAWLHPIAFVTLAGKTRLPARRLAAQCLPLFALAACQAGGTSGSSIPGDRSDTKPYDGIAADEIVHFTGTEPFWGGEVAGEKLIYKTPETPEGESIVVGRFAGRGGMAFNGTLRGMAFTLAISPGTCSDGMSDRSYPFLAMLKIGDAVRSGCGWTDKQPYTDPRAGTEATPGQ